MAAALEYFNRSTSALTEEDSDFSPADGMFTAAQQVAHAAQTIDWFIEGAFKPEGFDMNFGAHETAVRAVTSLAEARASLTKAVENAKQTIDSRTDEEWRQPLPAGPVMGGAPRAAIFGAITDHTAHHRGALTIYARLQGKTPPMPYM
ncbi:MAG: DinB family protein [Acidobacteria bacterium]|nr:DinB family protein [Acidobacteriota bacterium]